MRNRAESVNYKKRIKKCTKMKKNKKEKRAKWSKKTCGLSLKSKNSNCWQIKKTGVIFSQLFRKTVQKIIWKGVLYSGFEGERLSRFFCAKIQENVWIIRMKKEERRKKEGAIREILRKHWWKSWTVRRFLLFRFWEEFQNLWLWHGLLWLFLYLRPYFLCATWRLKIRERYSWRWSRP